jgi:hypothetical protein
MKKLTVKKLSSKKSRKLRGREEGINIRRTKTADMSALRAGLNLPPKKFLDSHFC